MASKNRKMLLPLIAALTAIPMVGAWAVSTNVDATATILKALVLTPSDLQFGKVTYAADPSAAGDFVRVATDDSRTVGGTFTADGGTIAAGEVAITGTAGFSVSVSCETGGILSNGTETINIINAQVQKESATGNWAAGIACTGTGNNILSFNLGAADDVVFVGGEINGVGASGPFVGGNFSTANAGGNDIQVDIVYT